MLSGKRIVKRARKIVNEHPEYFEVLMEFERTKKLPKLSYKKRVNFTIDENIFRNFRNFCQKKGYKMSSKIERFMEKEIS
ncbi:hypothetical protein K8R33_04540 [archaeon]|nr:hypothetical protein [archaeon]